VKAREVYSIAAVTSYIDTLMSQLGVNHTSQHVNTLLYLPIRFLYNTKWPGFHSVDKFLLC